MYLKKTSTFKVFFYSAVPEFSRLASKTSVLGHVNVKKNVCYIFYSDTFLPHRIHARDVGFEPVRSAAEARLPLSNSTSTKTLVQGINLKFYCHQVVAHTLVRFPGRRRSRIYKTKTSFKEGEKDPLA